MSTDHIPPLAKQVDAAQVIRPGLHRQYNSGMVQAGDTVLLATRVYDAGRNRCEIELQRLEGGRATPIRRMELPSTSNLEEYEDARLFWHDERLFMAYTEGHYYKEPYVSIQRLVELDEDLEVVRSVPLHYGFNGRGRSEKNWQFFSHEGRIHFVYGFHPHVVVAIEEDGRIAGEWTTPGIRWPYGTMSGGTPPVRAGGYYLSFFHSYVKIPARDRRYSFSAYLFSGGPPFGIQQVTLPLARGSANDPDLPNAKVPHWMPLVVFPCGHLVREDHHLLSVGLNDSFDAMVRLPLKLPFLSFDETHRLPERYYFRTPNGSRPLRLEQGYLEWQRIKADPLLGRNDGIAAVDGPTAEVLRGMAHEITHDDYVRLLRSLV